MPRCPGQALPLCDRSGSHLLFWPQFPSPARRSPVRSPLSCTKRPGLSALPALCSSCPLPGCSFPPVPGFPQTHPVPPGSWPAPTAMVTCSRCPLALRPAVSSVSADLSPSSVCPTVCTLHLAPCGALDGELPMGSPVVNLMHKALAQHLTGLTSVI